MCVLIETEGHIVIIDCGSGLLKLQNDMPELSGADILLSHLHFDHICGLAMFQPPFIKERGIRFHTADRSGEALINQVYGAFRPPYWPMDLSAGMVKSEFYKLCEDEAFTLTGGINVIPFKANHPDRTTAFRIECENKIVVYLLDNEINNKMNDIDRLSGYCKDADLVFTDSTYLPKDYEKRRGWGHSTYLDGIRLAERSNCKRVVFAHFSQEYSDEELYETAACIDGINERFFIAGDGAEYLL